jgi:hypothetical protein
MTESEDAEGEDGAARPKHKSDELTSSEQPPQDKSPGQENPRDFIHRRMRELEADER